MRFDVVTLFPDMVSAAASYGVTGRAIERNIVSLSVWNPRDYTQDRHRTVDDRPYGGGPGMVMKYQPLHDAVLSAKQAGNGKAKVVYLSPQGRLITQAMLAEACDISQLILVAGRYEGVDERFVDLDCDEEWSIGDYVISGGELAALIVIDGSGQAVSSSSNKVGIFASLITNMPQQFLFLLKITLTAFTLMFSAGLLFAFMPESFFEKKRERVF